MFYTSNLNSTYQIIYIRIWAHLNKILTNVNYNNMFYAL